MVEPYFKRLAVNTQLRCTDVIQPDEVARVIRVAGDQLKLIGSRAEFIREHFAPMSVRPGDQKRRQLPSRLDVHEVEIRGRLHGQPVGRQMKEEARLGIDVEHGGDRLSLKLSSQAFRIKRITSYAGGDSFQPPTVFPSRSRSTNALTETDDKHNY